MHESKHHRNKRLPNWVNYHQLPASIWLLMLVITAIIFLTFQFSSAQSEDSSSAPNSELLFLPAIFHDYQHEEKEIENVPNSEKVDEHDHFDGSHTHLGDGHTGRIPTNGRFTLEGQVWPPQMMFRQSVRWLLPTNTRTINAEQQLLQSAEEIAVNSAEIQALLGERFALNTTSAIFEKGSKESIGHTVTFFSYTNNQTIVARIENQEVASIDTIAPEQYQPPLTPAEIEEATRIARDYWLSLGENDRINELEGFGILGFENSGESGFLDTRMAYISFHVNNNIAPEYLTWVDLTNQTVTKAWEE